VLPDPKLRPNRPLSTSYLSIFNSAKLFSEINDDDTSGQDNADFFPI
jgi:hypothetical protein